MRARELLLPVLAYWAVTCALMAAPPHEPEDAAHAKLTAVMPASIKGATDAELFRWMADAPVASDTPAPMTREGRADALATTFWRGDSRSAATSLLQARSNPASALTGAVPLSLPRRYTITFSGMSERDEELALGYYFLRVDPRESYLAFARSGSVKRVDNEALRNQILFDLRFCPVAYDDACRVGEVVARLHVARFASPPPPPPGGLNRVTIRVKGTVELDRFEEQPFGWRERADHSNFAFLAAVGVVMTELLPDRLGAAWQQMEPKLVQGNKDRPHGASIYSEEEQERLGRLAERFLHWFSLGEERISYAIVVQSAAVMVYFRRPGSAEMLDEISRALPRARPALRDYDEVTRELQALEEPFELLPPGPEYPPLPSASNQGKRRLQRRASLEKELSRIRLDWSSDGLGNLRRSIATEAKMLALTKDPRRLYLCAISEEMEAGWALQRLATIDPARHAEALAWWVRNGEAFEALPSFELLIAAHPERALALAKVLPWEKPDDLALAAFVLMRDAGAMPEETKRLESMLAVLRDPQSPWDDRNSVLAALVPPQAPLRFPGREVDEAIAQLFEFGQQKLQQNFTLEAACRALTRRGRTDYFERILAAARKIEDPYTYQALLGALTEQAQVDLPRFKPALLALLKPELEKTNKDLTELLCAIWAADLRELAPALELRATRDPDEAEDPRAHLFGGSPRPVDERLHFARRILGLWSEPDPLTRVRMLLAFRISNSSVFEYPGTPERSVRLMAALREAGAALSRADKVEVSAFLGRLATLPIGHEGPRFPVEEVAKVTRLAREVIGL